MALNNALDYQSQPLLPILRPLLRSGRSSAGLRLPRLVIVFVVLLSLLGATMLVPANFHVSVSGELQPGQRRDVFAPRDAEVANLSFGHGDGVHAGQQLPQNSILNSLPADRRGDLHHCHSGRDSASGPAGRPRIGAVGRVPVQHPAGEHRFHRLRGRERRSVRRACCRPCRQGRDGPVVVAALALTV